MINGVLLVNKDRGIGSTKVVSKLRKIFNTRDVGHCGTLDPLAEGLLVVTLGNALKISKYLEATTKEYITTVTFGKRTDTLDLEGEFVEEKPIVSFTKDDVLNAFSKLKGKSLQAPPMYSAISKDGKRLYEYARNNESVEIKKREIEIYDLELLEYTNESITYKISCSKGTYIRVVNEDLAKLLSNIGYTSYLKRTKVGNFDVTSSYTLDEIGRGNCKLLSIKDSLSEFNKYYMNDFEYEIISHGNIFKKYLPGYQLMIDKNEEEIALYKGDEESKTTKCLRVLKV